MQITGTGYLTNTMRFRIDHEKPFFIEKVSLLPIPIYQQMKDIKAIYHTNEIDDDTYIMRTASGLIWSGSTATGRVNYSGSLEHIGSLHFQTSTGVVWWSNHTFIRSDEYIQDYVRTCPHIVWISELFYCPEVHSLLTE
jgi:hypothetical protein